MDFDGNVILQIVILSAQVLVLAAFVVELVRKSLYGPRNVLRLYSLLALSAGIASLVAMIFSSLFIMKNLMAVITVFFYWGCGFLVLMASIHRYIRLASPSKRVIRSFAGLRVILFLVMILVLTVSHIYWRFRDLSVSSHVLPSFSIFQFCVVVSATSFVLIDLILNYLQVKILRDSSSHFLGLTPSRKKRLDILLLFMFGLIVLLDAGAFLDYVYDPDVYFAIPIGLVHCLASLKMLEWMSFEVSV
jgi:hypothetical protein